MVPVSKLSGLPLGLGGGFCAVQRPVAVSGNACVKEPFLRPIKLYSRFSNTV